MKYVALLRGINVGGNTMIKMSDLKLAFEKSGFTNVMTYINSGNVIFESTEKNKEKLVEILETMLLQTFHSPIRVVVLSDKELAAVAAQIPETWKKENDLRCYIAFVKPPVTTKEIIKEIVPKEGIDFVDEGPGAVYLSTKLSGLTKSSFTKLASKKIYQDITIRNLNTTQKLLSLMGNTN